MLASEPQAVRRAASHAFVAGQNVGERKKCGRQAEELDAEIDTVLH